MGCRDCVWGRVSSCVLVFLFLFSHVGVENVKGMSIASFMWRGTEGTMLVEVCGLMGVRGGVGS